MVEVQKCTPSEEQNRSGKTIKKLFYTPIGYVIVSFTLLGIFLAFPVLVLLQFYYPYKIISISYKYLFVITWYLSLFSLTSLVAIKTYPEKGLTFLRVLILSLTAVVPDGILKWNGARIKYPAYQPIIAIGIFVILCGVIGLLISIVISTTKIEKTKKFIALIFNWRRLIIIIVVFDVILVLHYFVKVPFFK
jgi:hypothetical protein